MATAVKVMPAKTDKKLDERSKGFHTLNLINQDDIITVGDF